MKGKSSGASMSVMLALLAVLLVSLGFLSSQGGGREGMDSMNKMKGPPMHCYGKDGKQMASITKEEDCKSPYTWK